MVSLKSLSNSESLFMFSLCAFMRFASCLFFLVLLAHFAWLTASQSSDCIGVRFTIYFSSSFWLSFFANCSVNVSSVLFIDALTFLVFDFRAVWSLGACPALGCEAGYRLGCASQFLPPCRDGGAQNNLGRAERNLRTRRLP